MSDKIHECPKCGEVWSEESVSKCPRCSELAASHGYDSLLAAAKRMIEDQRFDYMANSNCPDGQEDDGVRIWNDLVAAIHAADPEYES